jgi:hypothetical protein
MTTFWDQAAGILGKVAPVLASAIGGPLAGVATSAIIGALGLAPDSTPEQAAAAVVGATADQMIQLKKADQDFEAKMKQLGIDADKLGNDDRASARARDIAVKDHTPSVLAYITVAGAFLAAGAVLTGHVGLDNSLAGAVIGYLFSDSKTVYSFFFGSSSSSEKKTDMIYNSTPAAGVPVRPLAS